MRFVWVLQPFLIILLPSAIYAYRYRHEPPRAVRGAGLLVAGMYVLVVGLFITAETLSDPGGWVGAGLVAAWLVPTILLSLLAWRRPDWARPVLVALVAVMAGVFAWSALDPEAWRSFEDDTGPVRGIMAFALTAPLALLAVRHLRDAGALLLVLGLLPALVLVVLRITDAGWVPLSLAMLDLPLLIVGTLFLVAARLSGPIRDNRPAPPRLPTAPRRPHATT